MKKVLFVATVTSHINAFHIPYLKWFKEQEYEVHVASNGEEKIQYCDKHFNLQFERNPLKIQNLKVYKELKKIIEKGKYEIIHCHTPIASVITRLAAKQTRKNGTRVIYTAHGFHFYKGAPLLNWFVYYPIEKWMSKYTDTLITINSEDYELAKRKFKSKKIELVHGVGFDNERFDIEITSEELSDLRKEIGIKQDSKILTYVAELNKNKNQIFLIKAIQELNKDANNKGYVLLLVGDGILKEYYQEYIKNNNLQDSIKLLGKRKDIPQILKLTDIYVASSLREGLPVNILEAMYMGVPVIGMDNRGHREIIKDSINNYIVYNEEELIQKIKEKNEKNKLNLRKNNAEIIEKYLLRQIENNMKRIYRDI